MRHIVVVSLVCLVVLASLVTAQQKPATKPAAAPAAAAAQAATKAATKATTGVPDKAMLAKVMNGWASLNPDNVTAYYDQSSRLPFYDVAPLKYDTFAAYMAGSKDMFATLGSLKFTMNDDAAVHPAGSNWAFSTATMHMRMEDKSGKATEVDCRWTAVWQRKGANWVIVHEHFSAPLPMEPPKQ